MNQLHFLQPLWLLVLIPLAILWWVIVRSKIKNSKAWEKIIDPKLLPLLLNASDEKNNHSESLAKWLLALVWLLATIALADPVWEKIPRPVFQTNSARVIVLDLSNSMQIDDLKPSRLARARFKIEDILSESFTKNEEGQVGLVLFAGDAFTASPLTRDTETIRALLQVLSPDLMPSQGSRVDLGLIKAHELLTQAGVTKGQVLLISDGVEDQDSALDAAKKLKEDGHTLSVLAVGTEIGGKLPQLKYRNGDSIVVALDSELLQEIASSGGGKFHLISTTDSDLKSVLTASSTNDINKPNDNPDKDINKNTEKNDDMKSEEWKSSGPFIILLLLPLAALAFRRGWLFSALIVGCLLGVIQPQPVFASPLSESLSHSWNNSWNNSWRNLWINKEQQAEKALTKQQYDKASSLSKKPSLRGSAHYKNEDYKKALKEFEQAKGADARYNEGNALAKLEKYQEAIKAYDEALKLQANMADAKKNKSAIEALLKKQKEQDSNDNKQQEGDNKDQKEGDSKKGNKNKNGKAGEQGEKKDSNDDEEKGKQGEKENRKDGKNQFSDANKNLDKQKDKNPSNENTTDNDQKTDQQDKENDSESKKAANESAEKESENKDTSEVKGTKSTAKELSKEEKMAAEQWLRRIPDDPGGLLRRKFEAQYKQRRRSVNDTKQPW